MRANQGRASKLRPLHTWVIWLVGVPLAHVLASYMAWMVMYWLGAVNYGLNGLPYAPLLHLEETFYCWLNACLYTSYDSALPFRALGSCFAYLVPLGLLVLLVWFLARRARRRLVLSILLAIVASGGTGVGLYVWASTPERRVARLLDAFLESQRQPGCLDQLLRSIGLSGEDSVGDVVQEIHAMGSDAVPFLAAELKSNDPNVRRGAALMIGFTEEAGAVPPLMGTLADEEAAVRVAGAEALGYIGAPQAVPDLLDLMDEEHSAVRHAAVYALSVMDDPEGIATLTEGLGDEDIRVRLRTAKTLGRIENPHTAPALIEALQDPESRVRTAAVLALTGIGIHDPAVVPALEQARRDHDAQVRQAATGVLGVIRELQGPDETEPGAGRD